MSHMNYWGIVDYRSGERTIVRAASNGHLHDPDAEREAQESFERPDIEF